MNILYQFNNNYAIYAGISIISLFENNKNAKEITIHILDDETDPISEENKNKFQEIAIKYGRKIIIYDARILIDLIKSLNIPTYRNCYAANMRLFLDRILPIQITRLLYLDADTLILGDITELFELDLEQNVIGMVLECQGNPIKSKIGLDKDTPYFNSGMILYDLQKWREENCSEIIINHAKNVRSSYVSPDQDLINIALKGQIKKIDLRYNYQPFHSLYQDEIYLKAFGIEPYYCYDELKSARNNIKIIHCYRFLGRFPWNKNSNHPNEEIWDKYLKISPWNGFEKIECNVMGLIKIEILLKNILPSYTFLKIFILAQKMRIKHLNRILCKENRV